MTAALSRRSGMGGDRYRPYALLMAILVSAAALASAEPTALYEIDWSSTSSGGVEVSGGDFAVLAEVGSPVTGDIAGTDFETATGFLNEDTAGLLPSEVFADGFESGDYSRWIYGEEEEPL